MKTTFAIPTALAASFAFTFSAVAEEKAITLKQSLPVGKKIHQSMVMNQKVKMGGIPGAPEGGGMNMTNKIDMGMSMDIKKHEEGKKAVIKYEKMGMLMDAGVFKQEFSSDEPGNPFSAMVGKEMTLIFNNDDEIQSVEGMDDLLGDAAGQPGIGDMLKSLFSEDQIKNTMNQSLLQNVPKKPLKIGDSWDFEMETPMPQGGGMLTVVGSYTVKKFDKYEDHPCVVLAMKGTLESDGKTKMEMQGQEIEMEFKDTSFEGDIYFDNKLGLPRKSDMLTKMKMAMNLGGLGQEMTMDMDMNMTMITKIEDSK